MRSFVSYCRFFSIALGLVALPLALASGQPPVPPQPGPARVGNRRRDDARCRRVDPRPAA